MYSELRSSSPRTKTHSSMFGRISVESAPDRKEEDRNLNESGHDEDKLAHKLVH